MHVTAEGLAFDAIRWRTARGEARLTLIAKATVALVDGEDARVVEPLPLFDDVSFEDNERRSLRLATDRAPTKARVDVLFAGGVYAPPLERVTRREVRLALEDERSVVLDRRLVAIGARTRTPSGVEGEPEPFAFLPVRYELSYGGASSRANPVGIGVEPRDQRLPQLLDPRAPKQPASLGPIAPTWWRRARHLGSAPPHGPFTELPQDLEPDFFNAAPPEQQIERLQGDEWIVLEGLHPTMPRVRSRLPSLGIEATVAFPGAPPLHVALKLDTLFVEGDTLRCALTFRGHVALGDVDTSSLRVVARLSRAGGPVFAPLPSATPIASPSAEPEADEAPESAYVPPPSVIPARVPAVVERPEARAKAPAEAPSLVLPPREGETVPIDNDSRFVVVTRPWQIRPPEDVLVVIAKATFDLVPGASATFAEEQLPPSGDLRASDDERSSLRYPSDFAVYKPNADVLLVGHAYPSKRSTSELSRAVARVGLVLGSLSRELVVIGDRAWGEDGLPTTPQPFVRIPLVWERAFGGRLSPDNPVGRGYRTGVLLPNLERRDARVRSAADHEVAPICFAPVDPRWRPRAGKLGTYDRAWLRARWPYYPVDFDHHYFNAAIPELQVPFLRGDEPFALSGVDPEIPTIEGRLPGVGPRVFALPTNEKGGELFEVDMRLDTVWFDADARKVVLVFRGLVRVDDDEASDLARLFVTQGRVGEAAPLESIRTALLARLPAPKVAVRTPANETNPAQALAKPPAPPPAVEPSTLRSWLEGGASLAGRDLTGADLSELDLRGRDLRRAILVRARLRGADLRDANLEQAVLDDADAEGAKLSGAVLAKASLVRTKLSGADLSGADLEHATLEGASAEGARFASAKARSARFLRATLTSAVFDGADLSGAELSGATLDLASFADAKLGDARFYEAKGDEVVFDRAAMPRARMDRSILHRASFVEVDATRSSWTRADLEGSVLRGAIVDAAIFPKAILRRVVLDRARARGAVFRKAILEGALLRKCDAMRASFEGADLRDADLRGANLYEVETWKAKLDRTRFELAHLAASRLSRMGGP